MVVQPDRSLVAIARPAPCESRAVGRTGRFRYPCRPTPEVVMATGSQKSDGLVEGAADRRPARRRTPSSWPRRPVRRRRPPSAGASGWSASSAGSSVLVVVVGLLTVGFLAGRDGDPDTAAQPAPTPDASAPLPKDVASRHLRVAVRHGLDGGQRGEAADAGALGGLPVPGLQGAGERRRARRSRSSARPGRSSCCTGPPPSSTAAAEPADPQLLGAGDRGLGLRDRRRARASSTTRRSSPTSRPRATATPTRR